MASKILHFKTVDIDFLISKILSLELPLAIAIMANMVKIAILAISAMAIGINNMVILGIQLKSIQKPAH